MGCAVTEPAIDALITRYAGALHQLANGLAPHESEIGPATAAIRAEFERLRGEVAAAEKERAELKARIFQYENKVKFCLGILAAP